MFIIANHFPDIHNKWGLLGHLMMYFENNMDPDQTAYLGSSLIRFILFASMLKVFLCTLEYMQQT